MLYYAIQVATSEEDDFARQAKKRDADLNFIIPKRTLVIKKNGKKSELTSPIFPGYVFLETGIPITESPSYYDIRRTRGFFRFLSNNITPTPLTAADTGIILHFAGFSGKKSVSRARFDENDRIVILEGPLKNYEGRIIKVDRRKGRAKVLLDLYENSFSVDFGFEMVKATQTASEISGASSPRGLECSPSPS